ncbi:MAG: hypothetical protein AB2A00_31740, partial [Myxococcota bacterium]
MLALLAALSTGPVQAQDFSAPRMIGEDEEPSRPRRREKQAAPDEGTTAGEGEDGEGRRGRRG